MGDLYLMYKNITRKKLRLCLTLFATVIAFMIYGTLMAFQTALNAGVDLSANNRLITVNKINFTQPLPVSYAGWIKSLNGVTHSVPMTWFGGYYQKMQNFIPMFAVKPDSLLTVYTEITIPQQQKKAWLQNRQALMVGAKTAARFGWKLGDRVPVSSNIYSKKSGGHTWDFDIVAIYKSSNPQFDTSSVYFHYKYFNKSRSFGRDTIGFIALKTRDPKLNEPLIKTIDHHFANSFYETKTMPEKAFNKAFIEQLGNIALIITFALLAAFFIILVIVGNSMALAIRERTAEIAVMKTLGFTSGRIFRMILGESLMLAFVGGAAGIGAATGLVKIAAVLVPTLPPLILQPEILLSAGGYMLLLGFMTGIIPAISAFRLNIVTALSR
ncbi:MAG: FtsX-like permease family protein [Alphaproteobacteria bacterium]|nr:FtsX-like permease family protein [Alphaproteobacteria bacterium]